MFSFDVYRTTSLSLQKSVIILFFFFQVRERKLFFAVSETEFNRNGSFRETISPVWVIGDQLLPCSDKWDPVYVGRSFGQTSSINA